jgi:transcriptional regulator with XRE-family HTH domain
MPINYEFLRKRRRDLDFSQEDIAYNLGISQKTYSDLENGKSCLIDIKRLNTLANLLKCSPSELCNNFSMCNLLTTSKYEKLKEYILKNNINIPDELL